MLMLVVIVMVIASVHSDDGGDSDGESEWSG